MGSECSGTRAVEPLDDLSCFNDLLSAGAVTAGGRSFHLSGALMSHAHMMDVQVPAHSDRTHRQTHVAQRETDAQSELCPTSID